MEKMQHGIFWNKKQDINRNIMIIDHTVFFKCLWPGDALPN